jgi:pimeloyl-ACP methyl ester carboxylesterase
MSGVWHREQRTIDGCHLGYRRGGRGQPMLFLQGLGAVGAGAIFDRLAETFDIIVPDHPGFGASSMPKWLDGIDDLAYFYLDFMAALDLQGLHLVGSSIGGWIAAELALRDAARLRTLALVSSAGLRRKGVEQYDIFMCSREELVRQLFFDPVLAEDMIATEQQAGDGGEGVLKEGFSVARLAWQPRLYSPTLDKWLFRIQLPTLIAWGAEDAIIPASYADEFARRIAHARTVVIDRCGHLPHREKPEELAGVLRSFVMEGA